MTTTTSAREAILTEVQARLKKVLVSGGFNTDAGAIVSMGESPAMGPDDPDESISIVIDPDGVGHQGERIVVTLPVRVFALVRADSTASPWLSVERIVTDIKRTIETDHDLDGNLVNRGLTRGSTSPLERESGSEFVGAEVLYTAMFAEDWGSP